VSLVLRAGEPLADHQVILDPGPAEVRGFSDLYGYVRWNVAPDRRVDDEARLIAEAGARAGQVLLGELLASLEPDSAMVEAVLAGILRDAAGS